MIDCVRTIIYFFFFKQLLENKLPHSGGEAISSIIGDNLSLNKKIVPGIDFKKIDSIFQQNFPFLKKNDQEGQGSDFPKIDSIFAEDKSEQALDFLKIDSAFNDNFPPHKSDNPDEDAKSDLPETEDGTYNYVYFVKVTPSVSVRSIIVANLSCNYGYRKDKTGKCRKLL